MESHLATSTLRQTVPPAAHEHATKYAQQCIRSSHVEPQLLVRRGRQALSELVINRDVFTDDSEFDASLRPYKGDCRQVNGLCLWQQHTAATERPAS